MNHDIHSGDTLLNLRLNHDLVATKRGRANLGAMLQSYFALGGFHVQFNTVSNEVLQDAQNNPGKCRSLLVRIAGCSAQFINLSREMQDSIMARNAHDDFRQGTLPHSQQGEAPSKTEEGSRGSFPF